MAFEWDPGKAKANRKKHGVSFADAAVALEDPWALTVVDEHPEEKRYVSLVMDPVGRVVVVVYTAQSARIRLISARVATPSERRQYEEQR